VVIGSVLNLAVGVPAPADALGRARPVRAETP